MVKRAEADRINKENRLLSVKRQVSVAGGYESNDFTLKMQQ